MTIPDALQILCPGAEWVLRGHTYDCLEWLDTVQVKPTEQAVLDTIAAFEYQGKRAREYPSLTDQLDALWKGGADMEAMRVKVMAVKSKYPKPGVGL